MIELGIDAWRLIMRIHHITIEQQE